MQFILGVKPDGNEKLFDDEVCPAPTRPKLGGSGRARWRRTAAATVYRFTNELALNDSHPDLMVNYLEYWEVDKKGGRENILVGHRACRSRATTC